MIFLRIASLIYVGARRRVYAVRHVAGYVRTRTCATRCTNIPPFLPRFLDCPTGLQKLPVWLNHTGVSTTTGYGGGGRGGPAPAGRAAAYFVHNTGVCPGS